MRYTFGHVLEVAHRTKSNREIGRRSVVGFSGPCELKVYLESARKPSDAATRLQFKNMLQRFEEGVEKKHPPRNQQGFQN